MGHRNAQNQLTSIDFADLTTATYAYDALGRRIEKDVNGAVTAYVYDGEDIALEFDDLGALLARYSHGQSTDQPLAMERGGQTYYYHADHLGSVRLVTDSAGAVVNRYDYDAYGNFEVRSEGVTSPYTFTGREFDVESGLFYYRARYYDANSGRFISEDPIGFGAGDANLYRYVFGNPLNFTDPGGLQAATPPRPPGVRQSRPLLTASKNNLVLRYENATGHKFSEIRPNTALTPREVARFRRVVERAEAAIGGPSCKVPNAVPVLRVNRDGAVYPPTPAEVRQWLENAGYPGRPTTQTSETGTQHVVPGSGTGRPTDVRVMDGGANHPPRITTQRQDSGQFVNPATGRNFGNKSRSEQRRRGHLGF